MREAQAVATAKQYQLRRVLCAVGLGETVQSARETAYALADVIQFDGCQLRRDIGARALNRR